MSPFRVILADPPWKFGDKLPGARRGAVKHYDCMTVEQIERFPLPPTHADAWLFLWRVGSMQEEALRVVKAWGFSPPTTEIVWVKTFHDDPESVMVEAVRKHQSARNKGDPLPLDIGSIACDAARDARRLRIGMGRSVRNCHEVCLIAKRGKPERLHADVPSVVFAERGEHSEKPEAVVDAIMRLTRGPYCELFARRQRPGWTCLGRELEL